MSGTSLDGIDVAIVDIRGRGFNTAAFRSMPYSAGLRNAILAISNCETTTGAIARMHVLLGELYASALRETCSGAGIPLESVELVGCHGQTIFHQAEPVKLFGRSITSTMQIGEADVIAERTGLPVVSDFRARDMAAGGKGAPLVPYVDCLLFQHRTRGRVALNIGGIANLTAIPAGASTRDVVAFDTGPGNMIIDSLVREHTGGKQAFDRNGRIARSGKVSRSLLRELLRDGFIEQAPPKAAGREQYGIELVKQVRKARLPFADLVATATAFTAAAVAEGLNRFVKPRMEVDDLIVSGGGAHNPALMDYLAAFLPGIGIAPCDAYGIDVDAKEAVAFAILAHETWRRKPSNLPSATGAKRAVILGKISC
jgi:anhydro-N-acetylmuramic acid kinase